jgi:hypothetical protein
MMELEKCIESEATYTYTTRARTWLEHIGQYECCKRPALLFAASSPANEILVKSPVKLPDTLNYPPVHSFSFMAPKTRRASKRNIDKAKVADVEPDNLNPKRQKIDIGIGTFKLSYTQGCGKAA